MYRFVPAFVSVFLLSSMPVEAQTWAEQQKMYNEKANLETELFQQREEMEKLQRKNKQIMAEQERQIEDQEYNLRKMKMESLSKPAHSDLDIRDFMPSKGSSQEVAEREEDARTRAFVEDRSKSSSIVFNHDHFVETGKALTKKGFEREDVSGMLYATKSGIFHIEERANQGIALDQRKLGILLLDDFEVKRNDTEGVMWLTKAANNGDAEAQAMLGRLYFEGSVVPKDDEESAGWYGKAAFQGHLESQFIIGGYFMLGTGLPQSDEKSYGWYKRAADRGYGDAQYALGLRYFYGKRILKDDAEAAFWFMLAGVNNSKFLKSKENRLLVATVLDSLSPKQKQVLGSRVTSWKPLP